MESGFVEADGKRLAALFADMGPLLGRATLGYLRLFRPAKQGLRLARAVKITQALMVLVETGVVCADERGGVNRPASPALWAAGIEQLLAVPPSGLPLTSHGYLRKVVFGLADKHEADAERRLEDERRQGHHRTQNARPPADDKMATAVSYANSMVDLDVWTPEQRDAYLTDARAKYGAASHAAG